ncbi:PEP-CTERM sorting domain-containing protein [Accumulibacter sp.]|uniref:PEP-CTERM sorting domain-containing protein n=1 Tax=Accumulibacter sp. TaxID=2053492 RepID=UPI0025F54DFE|nr:PEP-CTERM sorting domain-containing protein [Accumulibacter sp.]MCM8594929.1 PEP-CTERM sorting domain-containing protein [Accumulibacter sp.]MCM8625940.1 PEP-CTERM sorting domain-containing protein [Accumulibacter sp.]MDS4049075.1 PEP-CTERM sorting domain-containing protein [Accumulibacter sp.]
MIGRLRKILHTLLVIVAAGCPGSASAAFTSDFVAAGTGGQYGLGFYQAFGDQASQTFTGTGLGSVGEMQLILNLGPTGNTLNSETLGFTFYLNSVAVGTTTYAPFDQSIQSLDFTFPALTSVSEDWTLLMRVTTGVCAICRTVQLATQGNTFALVPEPATLALLGVAVAILGWSAGRRP